MDFYLKVLGDPNFIETQLEVDNEIELLLAQIDMILFTPKKTVLGHEQFGIDLEGLIYTLNINSYDIENMILMQINKFCPISHKYKLNVECKFFEGTERDIAVVDVTINDNFGTGIILN